MRDKGTVINSSSYPNSFPIPHCKQPTDDVKSLVTNPSALVYYLHMAVQRKDIPGWKDIEAAAACIKPYIHRTPVMTSTLVDAVAGGKCFFKMENFQKTGSFKIRGASYAVLTLSKDEAARGTATHSSGNHAQALALASRCRGVPSYIVMPRNAPMVKQDAVAGYGGTIIHCEPTLRAREEGLEKLIEQTRSVFIHPYDDGRIIAGQATCSRELMEDIPDLDIVVVPLGGGGLLSGTALAVKHMSPRTIVIGAEPKQADDGYRSFISGSLVQGISPDTIADGLRTQLSELTHSIIMKYVDDIVTVSEEEIITSLRIIWERMKTVIEPSAAVSAAAVMFRRIPRNGKRVGAVLTGGNVDLTSLPWKGESNGPVHT